MEQLPYDVSEKASPQPPVTKRKRWLGVVLVVVGGGLLVYGGLGFWQEYRATHNPRPLPESGSTVTHSVSKPDETPIKSESDYQVPANQPRSIELPTIGSRGFIQKVGLDQNGAVAVPGNVNLAGWFVGESAPGKPGLSIIDGHVQGKYSPGIFKNLGKLKPGDTFTVEFGDRSTKRFEVIRVESHAVADVAQHLFKKQETMESQLNLITCSGVYNNTSHQYDKRLLVVSKAL
jgi:sortase A